MSVRFALLAVLLTTGAFARSVRITSPASDMAVNGPLMFTVALEDIPEAASVEYLLDGHLPYATVVTPPFRVVVPRGTFYHDGEKTVSAIVRDALGRVVATSDPVRFFIREVGARLGFVLPQGPLSGMVRWQVTGTTRGRLSCYVDGRFVSLSFYDFSGQPDAVDTGTGVIAFPEGHSFAPGDTVEYISFTFNNVTTPLGGLNPNTTYYAIPAGEHGIRLAATRADALAGNALRIPRWTDGGHKLQWYAPRSRWLTASGQTLLLDTTQFPDGPHLLTCTEWTPAPGVATIPAEAIDPERDLLSLRDHNLITGRPVVLASTGTLPAPLLPGVTYYAIYVDEGSFRLAATQADAESAHAINLSGTGTGSHSLRFTVVNPFTAPSMGTPVAALSQMVNFANGAAPMEMRTQFASLYLVPDETANLRPFLANADASQTALEASDVLFFSSNPSVAEVAADGTVKAVAPGVAHIRLRYRSFATDILTVVSPAKRFRHFSRDGAILDQYTPGRSFVSRSLWELSARETTLTPGMADELKKAAINTTYEGLAPSAWRAPDWQSFLSEWTGPGPRGFPAVRQVLEEHNLSSLWIGDDWARLHYYVHKILDTRVPWRQQAVNRVLQDLRDSGRAAFIEMVDEANGPWRGNPVPDTVIADGGRFSRVTVTGCPATPCDGMGAVEYTGYEWRAGSWFQLDGATTENLNGLYKVHSVSRTRVEFRTRNVRNGTYTAATDPGLKFIFWQATDNSAGNPPVEAVTVARGTATVTVGQRHNLAAGRWVLLSGASNPLLNDVFRILAITGENTFTVQAPFGLADGDYRDSRLRLNVIFDPPLGREVLLQFMSLVNQTAGRPPVAWPVQGSSRNSVIRNWENPLISDYTSLFNTIYIQAGDSRGNLADQQFLRYTTPTERRRFRRLEGPLVTQVSATSEDYQKRVPGEFYQVGEDALAAVGDRPEMLSAGILSAVSQEAAAIRCYFFDNREKPAVRAALARGGTTSVGVHPTRTPALWRAMALAFNLVERLEPWILQPNAPAPDLGPMTQTGAKDGEKGALLLITNFLEIPRKYPVDLSPYRRGGPITRYIAGADRMIVSRVDPGAGTDEVELKPGQTAVYLFLPADSPDPVRTVSLEIPAEKGKRGASTVLRYGYWDTDLETAGEAVVCEEGACAVSYDPALGPGLYGSFTYLTGEGTREGSSGSLLLMQSSRRR